MMHVTDHTTLPFEVIEGRRSGAVARPVLGMHSFEVWIETLSPCARGLLACGQRSDRSLLVMAGQGRLVLDGAPQCFVAPCSLVVRASVECEVVNDGSDIVQLIVAFRPRRQPRRAGRA
jgi:hypothetical protein